MRCDPAYFRFLCQRKHSEKKRLVERKREREVEAENGCGQTHSHLEWRQYENEPLVTLAALLPLSVVVVAALASFDGGDVCFCFVWWW